MPGIRELLAVVLGVLLGLAAIAYPEVLLRIQTAGTRPDRRNGYGGGRHDERAGGDEAHETSGRSGNRARRFVQLLGVLALVISAIIAFQAF